MATKWNDLKHKTSPEQRDTLKQEALAELDSIEHSGAKLEEQELSSGHEVTAGLLKDDFIRERRVL